MKINERINCFRPIMDLTGKKRARYTSIWNIFCKDGFVEFTDLPDVDEQALKFVTLDTYCCCGTVSDTMTMSDKSLFYLLLSWMEEDERPGRWIRFTKDLAIGEGRLEYDFHTHRFRISIGYETGEKVSLSVMIRTGMALFRELAYERFLTEEQTPEEFLWSSLSVFQNPKYDKDYTLQLPHEAGLEAAAVLSMWSKTSSGARSSLMIDYLMKRVEQPYFFSCPDGGFRSKEQVRTLFEEVYQGLTGEKRGAPAKYYGLYYELNDPYFDSDDELAQMLSDEYPMVNVPYYPLYYQTYTAENGREIDRRTASFVTCIHPEMQEVYRHLDFSRLDPVAVFGLLVTETPEEILSRIAKQIYDRDHKVEVKQEPSKEEQEKLDRYFKKFYERIERLANPPKMTKEEEEEFEKHFDLVWKVLCEKGSVNLDDPLNTDTRSPKERLKDPNIIVWEYHNCDDMHDFNFMDMFVEDDEHEE